MRLPEPTWIPGDVITMLPWPGAKPSTHIVQHIDGHDTKRMRPTVFRASPETGPSRDDFTANWYRHNLFWLLAPGGRLVPAAYRCVQGADCTDSYNHLPPATDVKTDADGDWYRDRMRVTYEVPWPMPERGVL